MLYPCFIYLGFDSLFQLSFVYIHSTLDFFKEVLKGVNNQSTVVSTFAVRLPLCKLASVAEGNAKRELLSVLGFHEERMVRKLKCNYILTETQNINPYTKYKTVFKSWGLLF